MLQDGWKRLRATGSGWFSTMRTVSHFHCYRLGAYGPSLQVRVLDYHVLYLADDMLSKEIVL